jgi:SAM-dependent methyltransferase
MKTQLSPDDYIEFNREAYNVYAREYRTKLQSKAWTDGDIELVNYLQRYLPPGASKILDLGPGNGNVLNLLKARGFEPIGIELSPDMAELAQETAPGIPIVVDDFLKHDFGDERFMGIFACAFVHLFPGSEVLRVLQKIEYLLSSDGVALIATTKNSQSVEGYIEKKRFNGSSLRYRRKFTDIELRHLIEQAGLKVVDYSELHEDVDSSEDEVWMRFIVSPVRKS